MAREERQRCVTVRCSDECRRDVIQEGVDGSCGDNDGCYRSQRDAQIEQSRGECKKDEGHVVDVETGDEPGKGTEHHTKEQGAQ